uniref:Lrp/AsnC family transcriptional regulator n=1 Tax=Ralstonia sp. ASV6 TaxID=2795124 RepID=UPI0018EC1B17
MATKLRARTKVVPKPTAPPPELDRTDKAILRALQKDASISNVALAKRVNLSPAACLRRVERLKA